MSTIGTFTKLADGGFAGRVRTLTLDLKATFRPEQSDNDKAPSFRILVGDVEVGAAWKKTSRENNPYLAVKLDDPSFQAPIYASLVEADESHNLIWSRPRQAD